MFLSLKSSRLVLYHKKINEEKILYFKVFNNIFLKLLAPPMAPSVEASLLSSRFCFYELVSDLAHSDQLGS